MVWSGTLHTVSLLSIAPKTVFKLCYSEAGGRYEVAKPHQNSMEMKASVCADILAPASRKDIKINPYNIF